MPKENNATEKNEDKSKSGLPEPPKPIKMRETFAEREKKKDK